MDRELKKPRRTRARGREGVQSVFHGGAFAGEPASRGASDELLLSGGQPRRKFFVKGSPAAEFFQPPDFLYSAQGIREKPTAAAKTPMAAPASTSRTKWTPESTRAAARAAPSASSTPPRGGRR